MSLLGLCRVMGLTLGLALVLGAVSAWAQTGGLTGTVKGEDGQPMVGNPILIERQDVRGTYKTKTNKKGEYIYIGLPIGQYKVTLQSMSGAPIYYMTSRVGLGDPTQLDFDMAKEKVRAAEEQKRQIEANPELKRQQEQQERETKQFTGLKQTFDQGQLLMNEKRYAEAAQMFEQALPLAKDKNIPVVLARLAQAYSSAASLEPNRDTKAAQREKALDYYHKAIQTNPTDATLHNNLGSLLADMGKTQEAAAEFQKAAEMDPPQASRYQYNYGVIMYNQGKMDEAAEAFGKATQSDPNYADAFYMRGRSLMAKLDMDPKTGKIVAAPGTVEALEAYLKLEPQGKHAADVQTMLQTVQGTVETEYKKKKAKS